MLLKHRRSVLIIAAVLTGVTLSGCGGSGSGTVAPTVAPGSGATPVATTFIAAVTAIGDQILDPPRTGGESYFISYLVFDPIVGTTSDDAGLSKDTGIAKDWTISPDGLVYVFTLRDGVKFSDGTSVTADDVKFTLERLAGPLTNTQLGRAISDAISSVTVLGPQEVEVRLKGPSRSFLESLSRDASSSVVPKAYIEKVGEDEFNANPIGSGPYKIDKHELGSSIEFVPASQSHFAVGTPPFSRIILRAVHEESTRVAQLKTGDADFIDVSTENAARLGGEGFRIIPHSLQTPLPLNFTGALQDGSPLRDLNLRKALSYSIDRKGINESLYNGLGGLTQSPFPGQVGGQPRAADPYDVEKAKALLALTPYGTGTKPLTVQLYSGDEGGGAANMLPLLQAIQANWKDIGVETDVQFIDAAILREKVINKQLPGNAMDIAINPGRRDWSGMGILFSCGGLLSRVCDPELDPIFVAWKAASSEEAYQKLAVQAEAYLEDHYYIFPVLTVPVLYATSNKAIFSGGESSGLIHLSINTRGFLYQQ